MKRLTDRMFDGTACVDVGDDVEITGHETTRRQIITRLAAYEDAMTLERTKELAQAEKDGRLVVLPCKVGDPVYVTYGEGYRLHVVDRIYVAGNQEVKVRMRNPCTMSETLRLDASNFGKTVFLTEEEAEKALTEGRDMKKGTYVAYRAPDGSILLDWEGKLWKTGYPAYPKDRCVELERGESEGGISLPKLYAKMKKKYGEEK